MAGTEWSKQRQITRRELVDDLGRLGLTPGADVLVHSSLSRIGHVVGGADAVVDALLDVVGPGGTVLFPTLTGARLDGPDHPPVVDVKVTPGWTGRIPETARQRPEALRSLHPTHSIAAIGSSADLYAAGHELTRTPCDEQSPYFDLVRRNGWILLLGVTQESNTTLHCLEELADVPYHLQDDWTDGIVINCDGTRQIVRNRFHLWKWHRDFEKIDAPLLDRNLMRIGAVGLAESRLLRATDLAEVILPMMKNDPLYLLALDARAAFS